MSKKRRKWEKPSGESTGTTTVPVGALVPQPHGGALRNGGTNKGGSGPVPSVLRERLRGSAAERIAILEGIADGKVSLTLTEQCPKCNYVPSGKVREENDLRIPSVGDRRAAVDTLLKYGLGERQDVDWRSIPDISRFVDAVERSIRLRAPEVAELVIQDVKLALKPGGE